MEKKHILVIAQYYYPEQFRINDITLEWVKKGYRVTVLTGIPNYPEGKFYKGYGWFKNNRELFEGVEIIRIPLIARGHNPIQLVLNYYSFVISGFFWRLFTKLKPDLVFIYEVSPMTQALVGTKFARKRKLPCYLYVTDLWPENVEIMTGIHARVVISPIERMVRKIYQGCTKILVPSKAYIEPVIQRGAASDKVMYWPQYAEDFYSKVDYTPCEDGRFHIAFAGNIGEAQGLCNLPRVARLLKEVGETAPIFDIIGDGRYKETLQEKVAEEGVETMFSFAKRIPASKVKDALKHADAALISLSDNEVFAKTVPAKTQSLMAMGLPILVFASGEVQNVIREAKCGVCADAGDEKQLLKAISDLVHSSKEELNRMRENALNYYNLNFSKENLLAQLDQLFE